MAVPGRSGVARLRDSVGGVGYGAGVAVRRWAAMLPPSMQGDDLAIRAALDETAREQGHTLAPNAEVATDVIRDTRSGDPVAVHASVDVVPL